MNVSVLVHNLVLTARQIERYLDHEDIKCVLSTLSETEQAELIKLVQSLDAAGIKKLIDRKRSSCLNDLNMREIRQIAQRLAIRGYSQATKGQLIHGIKHTLIVMAENQRRVPEYVRQRLGGLSDIVAPAQPKEEAVSATLAENQGVGT